MTIVRRVVVTEYIVDAVFVASTPKAAHLCGYREPNDLVGKWLSQTHSHDIARRSFALSYYRHVGQKIGAAEPPSSYVTFLSIPDRSTRSIIKQTQEVVWEGEMYWITEIEEATGETGLPSIFDIELPVSHKTFESWSGVWTIADVEGHLALSLQNSREEKKLTESAMVSSIDGVDQGSIYGIDDVGVKTILLESMMRQEVHTQKIPLHASATGRMQRDHFLHRCSECHGTWIGTTQNPAQCIYCASRLWRGFSKRDQRKRLGEKP